MTVLGGDVKTSEFRAVQFENVYRASTQNSTQKIRLRDSYDNVKGMIVPNHDYLTGLPKLSE